MKKIILSMILIFVMALALVSADDLSGSITSLSGDPGSSVTYTLTLINSGSSDLTVSSTSSTLVDSSGNIISAPTISSVLVTAGNSASTTFAITVPSTKAGVYTGIISSTDGGSNTESFTYTLTVNSKDAFTTSESSITLNLNGEAESDTYTITNTGSTTLSSWTIVYASSDGDSGKIIDDNDDEIIVTMTGASTSLAPGSSMTITVKADPDNTFIFGTYSGTITMTATGSASTSATMSLSVVVESDICENGKQGSDFDIDIRSPDSSDDFNPGDTISIEVKVGNEANDNLDVELEAVLYNIDTGDKVKTVKEEGSIDEDETETFSFELDLPSDLDENDDYKLFIQVHDVDAGEDDSCDYESVSVDIKRESSTGRISQASVTPAVGLTCNEDYRVSLYVESTGDDSLTDAYLELRDADLDVSDNTDSFDLGDYNDDDNEKKFSFDYVVPKDLVEGTYSLEAILYSKSGKVLDSELIDIVIDSCTAEDALGDLDFKVSEDYEVVGNELTLSLIVKNSGDSDAVISVAAEEVAWATLTSSEYLTSLEVGDEAHAYLYYTLDSETQGKHDIKIIVTDDRGNEVSNIVTVDFGVDESTGDNSTGISSWLSDNAKGTFWIIIDVILVILAILFVRMFFKKN